MQATSWQRDAFALQQIAIMRQVLSIVNKYLLHFDKDTQRQDCGNRDIGGPGAGGDGDVAGGEGGQNWRIIGREAHDGWIARCPRQPSYGGEAGFGAFENCAIGYCPGCSHGGEAGFGAFENCAIGYCPGCSP